MDQLNRPKTRGLEATEADEDSKFIKAALKEPSRFIKKAHQKLKSDYGRDKDDDSDEESKIFYQQPPYDDETETAKPGTRRRRGGRRSYVRKKARGGDGEEEMSRRPISAKLAALLKEEARPRLSPNNNSSIEFKHVWYQLGDVVFIHKNDTKYYAQIVGFHTDQFCERYVSVRWLLPKWDLNNPFYPSVTIDSFRGAVPEDNPINMSCFCFAFRPPAQSFQPEYPQTVTRDKYYVYNSKICFFDSPSFTLTSTSRRY